MHLFSRTGVFIGANGKPPLVYLKCLQFEEYIMKVTIYGPGCARCQKTAEVVQQTLSARGIPVELEKVSDYAAIAAAGVMATPGVSLDGKLVSTGKLPSVADVESWLA